MEEINIQQTLIGVRDSRSLKHCDGVARIFKHRGNRPPRNMLEKNILLTLRGPVVRVEHSPFAIVRSVNLVQVFQAFFVEESYFTDAQWENTVNGFMLPGEVPESGFFTNLAATARLFQRARRALTQNPRSQEDIERLAVSAADICKSIGARADVERARIVDFKHIQDPNRSEVETKFLHNHYTRQYGLTITTMIQANVVHAALDERKRETLEAENSRLCRELCVFVPGNASWHRPLGSLTFKLMLQFAFIGAATPEDRQNVLNLLLEFSSDCPTPDISMPLTDMMERAKFLSLKDPSRAPPPDEFWT